MSPRSATVLFKDQPCGILAELENGSTRFSYNEDWKLSVACALSAEDKERLWKGGLHPFFQHLGPEGWLREKQARVGRVDEEDDFGLLLRYGADCIGAVSIQPNGDFELPEHIVRDPETEAATSGHRTVSGVQRKLLAYKKGKKFHPSGQATPATHIAKFNSAANDTLVRNEYLTLRLACDLLGSREVTKFEIGEIDELREQALVVERFDRAQSQKLRLEDFAQILAKPRGLDFRGKYEASYEDVAEALMKFSVRPVIDLDRLFRRIVVNIVVGNADAHLKNFSLLETPQGMRLSPAYDMLNTLWYGAQFDTHLALGMNGSRPLLDEIDRQQVLAFGMSIGLKEKAATKALRDIQARLAQSATLKRTSAAPSEYLDRYEEVVRNAELRILSE